jgi:hypothetical protein
MTGDLEILHKDISEMRRAVKERVGLAWSAV